MRPLLPSLLVVAALTPASTCFAERRRAPPNVVTTNPLATVLAGTANVEYERAIAPWASLFVGPQVQFGYGVLLRSGADDKIFGLGLSAGARFYVFGDAPRGFFLSPQLDIAYVTLRRGSAEGSGAGFGIAALIGYQWLVADHFAISLGIGGRYLAVTANASSGGSSASTDTSGFGLAGRLALGAAF